MELRELPLGYVFAPTGQQLIEVFLTSKLNGGQEFPWRYYPIRDADVYNTHPLELIKDNHTEGYFFTPLKKIGVNKPDRKGTRYSRYVENCGTWLETARTKYIHDDKQRVIGTEKYYRFNPIQESKSCDFWKICMHEYMLVDRKDFALCRITKNVKDKSKRRYVDDDDNGTMLLSYDGNEAASGSKRRCVMDGGSSSATAISVVETPPVANATRFAHGGSSSTAIPAVETPVANGTQFARGNGEFGQSAQCSTTNCDIVDDDKKWLDKMPKTDSNDFVSWVISGYP